MVLLAPLACLLHCVSISLSTASQVDCTDWGIVSIGIVHLLALLIEACAPAGCAASAAAAAASAGEAEVPELDTCIRACELSLRDDRCARRSVMHVDVHEPFRRRVDLGARQLFIAEHVK